VHVLCNFLLSCLASHTKNHTSRDLSNAKPISKSWKLIGCPVFTQRSKAPHHVPFLRKCPPCALSIPIHRISRYKNPCSTLLLPATKITVTLGRFSKMISAGILSLRFASLALLFENIDIDDHGPILAPLKVKREFYSASVWSAEKECNSFESGFASLKSVPSRTMTCDCVLFFTTMKT
jgi:hypothetical protein